MAEELRKQSEQRQAASAIQLHGNGIGHSDEKEIDEVYFLRLN